MFDDSLAETVFDNGISILYAGVGDARHLYATLLAISKSETRTGKNVTSVHITMNDIQAPTIARILIILSLLQQFTETSHSADDSRTMILITIIFGYCGHVMPPCATNYLQRTISGLIKELNGGNVVSSVISVPDYQKAKLLKSLVSWQGEVYEIISKDRVAENIMEGYSSMPPGHVPSGCKEERAFWSTTGKLQLPDSYRSKQEASASTSNEAWKINATLFDVVLEKSSKTVEGIPHEYFFNPFSLADHFYVKTELEVPKEPTCLYDYVAPFFVDVASAIKLLGTRLSVDVVHGEMTAVMEKMRYGFLDGHEDPEHNAPEGKKSPTKYDRVHMSNIP